MYYIFRLDQFHERIIHSRSSFVEKRSWILPLSIDGKQDTGFHAEISVISHTVIGHSVSRCLSTGTQWDNLENFPEFPLASFPGSEESRNDFLSLGEWNEAVIWTWFELPIREDIESEGILVVVIWNGWKIDEMWCISAYGKIVGYSSFWACIVKLC